MLAPPLSSMTPWTQQGERADARLDGYGAS
jgi:hypothetical protein